MSLYKLRVENNKDIASATLEKAQTDSINYERDFENWLENSPHVLLDEDDESSVIWIGRQTTASIEENKKYPDLLGVDVAGNLIIVELKKGRTPRDVIAQILEYASWGSTLTYEELNEIADKYFKKQDANFSKSLLQVCQEEFFSDSDVEMNIEFNKNQKMFIIAEEISSVIRQVSGHLRTKYQINIHCMEYEILKSQQGEYFVSTEKIVGYEGVEIKKPISTTSKRWNHPVKVRDVIREAITTLTKGDYSVIFKPVVVYSEIVKQYPDINRSTVGCQIIQDCVNHTSRKYYPSGQRDLLFLVEKGRFRLYNPLTDGKWNWKGEESKNI